MKKTTLVLFVFFIGNCFSQDTLHSFKINQYKEKIAKYLDKKNALSSYYSIDKNGITLFASAKDKSIGKKEFSVQWEQIPDFNNLVTHFSNDALLNLYKNGKLPPEEKYNKERHTNEKALSGYKIAIDPGHTAGSIVEGKLEQKYLKFKINLENGKKDSIEIAEGMLTFATAQLLKEKLEKEGAEVFITRPFNGASAFGKTFDDWLKTDYNKAIDSLFKLGEITLEKRKWLLTKANKRDKFRLIFKNLELKKRAEIINNYQPDFSIIIHYNVDETNTGWTKPTTKNFNMAFVGGAFMPQDLSSPEKRFEFLRLLISDQLDESIKLSGYVVNSFEENLKVNTAQINDAGYLKEGCLITNQKGVFCRNLQLTRYVHSPLVYGETLFQDNINESKLLNEKSDKTKNERIQQVAESYFKGIINYVEKNK